MSSLYKHHKELTNGKGYCSVPMWDRGYPAGFCNKEAYGMPEEGQTRYGNWKDGKFLPGYSSGLVCYHHGGPEAVLCTRCDTIVESVEYDPINGGEIQNQTVKTCMN